MFRSKSVERKSKSNGLLNLALQDNEWLIKTGANEYQVDHGNKDILLPLDLVNANTKQTFNKVMKILALADAKYGKAPKMVGVKHLQPYYIDMAMMLSVYWYTQKKAFPKFDIPRSMQFYTAWMNNDGKAEGIAEMVKNNVTLKFIVKAMINDPWLALHESRYKTNIPYLLSYNVESSTFSNLDKGEMKSRGKELCRIVATAVEMTMSVRKDAKKFPTARLKEVAQYLHDMCEDNNLLYHSMPSEAMEGIGDIEIDLMGMKDFSDENNTNLESAINNAMRRDGTDVRWAKMEISYPLLEKSLPNKLLGKSKKYSDMGVAPRAMHRDLTDKKVFTSKSKRKSGTVLIDVSGSMSFTEEDVQEIIETLPASTVAIYSGDSDADAKEPHKVKGTLRIVGKNGRYVKYIPDHGLHNLIDGPAIEWLSKQAEPRILVSDLQFTGIDYANLKYGEVSCSAELITECMQMIATKNIIPIPNIDKAKEWVVKYRNA
tara:strand:- start:65 stop:1528 length:1464 start_codon:yes stop_codon:yes gene_type:complete